MVNSQPSSAEDMGSITGRGTKSHSTMGQLSAHSTTTEVQAPARKTSVQSLSCVRLFATPQTDCSTLGFPVHHQLPELTQTHVHLVGDGIQLSDPLSTPSPPAFNLSQHQGLSNESVLHIRWPKYRSFSFIISPFNEFSGLISFRIDLLDLLAVQGTN